MRITNKLTPPNATERWKAYHMSKEEYLKYRSEISNKYYYRNKKECSKRTCNLALRNQAFIKQYLKNKTCYFCNKDSNYRLEFHHLLPSKKRFRVCCFTGSISVLKLEIEKCVLLCEKCHAKLHFKLLKGWSEK